VALVPFNGEQYAEMKMDLRCAHFCWRIIVARPS
jgi:hypothetical protein